MEKGLLQELSRIRCAEAVHLFEAGFFSGSYYLAGYAVELGLKAVIAPLFKSETIPDRKFVEQIHTHNLDTLVTLADLAAQRRELARDDGAFAENWEVVKQWSESTRYVTVDKTKAETFLNALRDPHHGVLQWIGRHW